MDFVLSRPPIPALRPFIRRIWVTPAAAAVRQHQAAGRERVLPTGAMHLAIRLSGPPLRVFPSHASAEEDGRDQGHAVVGGARTGFYIRALAMDPSASVGALLEPGAGTLLFGVPAEVLANQHTPLDALWGSDAGELFERLGEAPTPARRLEVLEDFLVERARGAGISPVVSFALSRIELGWSVTRIVERTGYSHRHFLALFRGAVGLGPKEYARLVRFGRALDGLVEQAQRPAEVAIATGFSDQAHFNREFRAFAGLTPGEYLALSPRQRHHVAVSSDFFKTAQRDVGRVSGTLRSTRNPR